MAVEPVLANTGSRNPAQGWAVPTILLQLGKQPLSTPWIPHSWGMDKKELRDTLKLPAASRCTVTS